MKRRVLVQQSNFFLEYFEEVRKAWGGLVKESEVGQMVAEVEQAINLVGDVDLHDPTLMKMKNSSI